MIGSFKLLRRHLGSRNFSGKATAMLNHIRLVLGRACVVTTSEEISVFHCGQYATPPENGFLFADTQFDRCVGYASTARPKGLAKAVKISIPVGARIAVLKESDWLPPNQADLPPDMLAGEAHQLLHEFLPTEMEARQLTAIRQGFEHIVNLSLTCNKSIATLPPTKTANELTSLTFTQY